jgi:hypothetical protein
VIAVGSIDVGAIAIAAALVVPVFVSVIITAFCGYA